jgi:plasmid maintenance system antidote protein VapI
VTRRDLATLLGDTLDLASLCSLLNLRQPEVMKLLRGKTPLTPDQIEVVARVTGVSAEEIASTVRPLPLELVVSMEHPRWRSTWMRRARRLHVSEAQARLTGSYGTFALAARETGGGEPNWDNRLRQFLRDEETNAGGT